MEVTPITSLYSILHGQVLPLAGDLLDSQLANLVRLMEGLFEGRSVHLSRIASNLTARATNGSVVAQLNRFLGNGKVDVRALYEPMARELLRQASAVRRVVLIMDSTKVGFSSQLMLVSLADQGRSLPLIWTWLEYRKGHSLTATQVELLSTLRRWPWWVTPSLGGAGCWKNWTTGAGRMLYDSRATMRCGVGRIRAF